MTEISFETAVARILRRHGAAVMDDPIRFRNLLRDHCTSEQCRREINVTLLCTRSGLLAQIFASDTSLPSDVQLGRYAAILHEEYGIDESFARTVVQIWLDGLAIAQEHDETVRKGWKPNGIQEIGESWTIPDLGMVLMPVDSGSFQMGSEDEYGGQKPARVVQITRPYWIGKTEVTQAEYRNITGESPSFFYGDDLPVEGVNWDDAVAFCDELTRREHTAGRLPQGYVYRLPTEAEWEYAARGGNKSKGYTYSGGNFINEVAWYSGNSENMPHPVGLKMPNELGICDMGGNIAEWCADWQQNSYRGIPDSDVKRLATGPYRVFRGGGWHHGAWCCRPVERNGLEPSSACAFLGFRVVLAPVLDFGVETTSRNLPSSADTKPPHDTKEDISGVNAGDGISSHRPAPEHPWTIPDLGMMLMPVAAGSFQMGSEVGENYEKPVRTVRISHDFWVGKTQVTQAEYRKVTGESPSFFHGDDLPVEKVSWGDAEAFCEKLTNCEREAGRLPQGYVYRLPTEAEWEYAAKGGNKSKGFTYSGGNDIDAVAWYYGNAGKTRLDDSSWSVDKLMENGNCTHPVGQKTANELGLHDMSGNVCEWCSDWFQESYSGLPVADPEGPTIGMHRVYRGGCSDSSPAECLSTTRHWCSPSETPAFFGLRIVLAPALNNVDVETTKRPRNEPIAARPWTIPDLGMVMIPVEAGSFAMGEENGFFNAKPIRTVRITRDFWVGKMEVTQAEYRKVTSESPSDFHGDDLPVEKVSWGAAEAFCDGLTRRERMARRLPQGYVYRLPTEAEWEYAAKGGTKSKGFIYAGGNNIDEVAWHRKNSNNETHPVGQKTPNELGICDMSGNVWEWCSDWYQDSYSGLQDTDPIGPGTGSDRVFRGGSWFESPLDCSSTLRNAWRPWNVGRHLGFRVVLAPALDHEGETRKRPWWIPDLDMMLMPVASGSFHMGADWVPSGENAKLRTIRISRDYWIGRTEVTNEVYDRFLLESRYEGAADADCNYLRHRRDWNHYASTGPTYPMVCVSWKNASEFCKWLTNREHTAGRLPQGYVYRLPTEAEWEYAAKGREKTKKFSSTYSGSEDLDTVGWHSGNSERRTHPVGGKSGNALGLHDMSGNVWEWCLDWYASYPASDEIDPTGPTSGSHRVYRGGSFSLDASRCQSISRGMCEPSCAHCDVGFRVVLAPALESDIDKQ